MYCIRRLVLARPSHTVKTDVEAVAVDQITNMDTTEKGKF